MGNLSGNTATSSPASLLLAVPTGTRLAPALPCSPHRGLDMLSGSWVPAQRGSGESPVPHSGSCVPAVHLLYVFPSSEHQPSKQGWALHCAPGAWGVPRVSPTPFPVVSSPPPAHGAPSKAPGDPSSLFVWVRVLYLQRPPGS